MKYPTLVVIILLCMPTHAKAQDELSKYCQLIGRVAELAMKHRQIGHTMSRVKGVMGGTKYVDEIIEDAFKSPVLESESEQAALVRKFKNEVHGSCVKTFIEG